MHGVGRRPLLVRFALLLACVLAFASHVCVLPAAHHAHAAAAAGDGHDGINAASCEMVAAQPTPTLTLVAATTDQVVSAQAQLTRSALSARPTPALHRPPRFLLHAALLI
jgi:hypothetical protein